MYREDVYRAAELIVSIKITRSWIQCAKKQPKYEDVKNISNFSCIYSYLVSLTSDSMAVFLWILVWKL